MYGMQSVITSPSSFSMRRSTPWVDGCWGPMLTYISSIVSPVRSIITVVPMGIGRFVVSIRMSLSAPRTRRRGVPIASRSRYGSLCRSRNFSGHVIL